MSTKLFVGNVSHGVSPDILRGLFEDYGKVLECDIITDYAFVHFEIKDDALRAVENLDGYSLNGNCIRVQLSKSKVRQKAGMSGSGCYKCGEEGHWSKDCPNQQIEGFERRPSRGGFSSRGGMRGRGGDGGYRGRGRGRGRGAPDGLTPSFRNPEYGRRPSYRPAPTRGFRGRPYARGSGYADTIASHDPHARPSPEYYSKRHTPYSRPEYDHPPQSKSSVEDKILDALACIEQSKTEPKVAYPPIHSYSGSSYTYPTSATSVSADLSYGKSDYAKNDYDYAYGTSTYG